MILEGVVTTLDKEGRLNVAPMGPICDPSMDKLLLRPFQTSVTYQNLRDTRCGVLHVTDDVLIIAKAVTHQLPVPDTVPAEKITGRVLTSACRWYEFTIDEIDDTHSRTECPATVVHTGRQRDFFGFNRAKHAVIEAAIFATRTHLLDRAKLLEDFASLKVIVEKTASPVETEAFRILSDFVHEQTKASPCAKSS